MIFYALDSFAHQTPEMIENGFLSLIEFIHSKLTFLFADVDGVAVCRSGSPGPPEAT